MGNVGAKRGNVCPKRGHIGANRRNVGTRRGNVYAKRLKVEPKRVDTGYNRDACVLFLAKGPVPAQLSSTFHSPCFVSSRNTIQLQNSLIRYPIFPRPIFLSGAGLPPLPAGPATAQHFPAPKNRVKQKGFSGINF